MLTSVNGRCVILHISSRTPGTHLTTRVYRTQVAREIGWLERDLSGESGGKKHLFSELKVNWRLCLEQKIIWKYFMFFLVFSQLLTTDGWYLLHEVS